MEVIFAFVFFYACWRGLCGAADAVGNAYTSKVNAWDAKHPDASWAQRRGSMFGYLFTMLKDGIPASIRGWKKGWAQGKAEGWEKWGKDRPDPDAAQEPDDPNKADDPKADDPKPDDPKPDPKPDPPPNGGPNNGNKPRLKIVKPSPSGGGPSGSSGAEPMAVEVNSIETLKSFAVEKKNLAATLKEEASLGVKRTEQEIAATENAIAWMRKEKFHDDDIAIVTALLEAEKRELAGHKALLAALDGKTTAAGNTETMAVRHIGIQQARGAGVYAKG